MDVGIIFKNISTGAASEIGSEYPIQDDENTDDILSRYKDHDSKGLITTNADRCKRFIFSTVTGTTVKNLLKCQNSYKARGFRLYSIQNNTAGCGRVGLTSYDHY